MNGFHLVGFCDSTTQLALDAETESAGVTSFAHNSFAYMGYRNASDPTDLWNFGNVTSFKGTPAGESFKSDSGKFTDIFTAASNETGSFAMWTTGKF